MNGKYFIDENRTLGSILEDPIIAKIAPDAIKDYGIEKQEMYGKTLKQLHEEHFGGNIIRGFQRLFDNALQGKYYIPVYTDEEIAADPTRKGVNLVYFPADDKEKQKEKPFILLVPGGGFVNVWNLTEGWPVADHFNKLGYAVFILTYRVGEMPDLATREMEDFAYALRLIKAGEEGFGVNGDAYIPCGFSAGGFLVCSWCTKKHGYGLHGLPKPQAVFPVYPLVAPSLVDDDDDDDDEIDFLGILLGDDKKGWETPEYAADFPPTFLFLAADDTLVSPRNSTLLKEALEKAGVPVRMEMGPNGGHGFAEAEGMCMEGWCERAIENFEKTVPRN
ncbi:MAG: hypothetical protein CW338_02605 [Clostridiales bacterium]|nr:hypothetical protein [Clostridiales bacterium]